MNISRTRALMALYSFLLLFYNLLFGSISGSACAVANIVAIAAATIRDRKCSKMTNINKTSHPPTLLSSQKRKQPFRM